MKACNRGPQVLVDALVEYLGDTDAVREFAALAAWDCTRKSLLALPQRQHAIPAAEARHALAKVAKAARDLATAWGDVPADVAAIIDVAQWGSARSLRITHAQIEALARATETQTRQLAVGRGGQAKVNDDGDIVRHLAKLWQHLDLGPIATSARSRFVHAIAICFESYGLRAPSHKIVKAALAVDAVPGWGPVNR